VINDVWRKWLRRCALALAWLILAVVLLVFGVREYLDWSGRRHWAAVQAEYAREGESLDLRAIVPDPVPDAQNFCAIPALKDLPLWKDSDDPHSPLSLKIARINAAAIPNGIHWKLPDSKPGDSISDQYQRVVKAMDRAGYTSPPRIAGAASYGKPIDMAAWAAWLRKDPTLKMPPPSGNPARDVLTALAKSDPLIRDLAAGLSRPEAQWTPPLKTRVLPEPYSMDYRPYITPIQKLVAILTLRAAAAAHAGDATAAHQSLLIALRLNQANMQNPFLIWMLISCGNSSLVSNTVWELCDAQSGTDADFQRLQEQLERLDYQKSFLYSVRSEVTVGVDVMDYLTTHGFPNLTIYPYKNSWKSMDTSFPLIRTTPIGWFEGNTATITQWYLDYYIKPLREGGIRQMLPRQQQLSTMLVERQNQPVYEQFNDFLAVSALSPVHGIALRITYAQSQLNEAIAACALERYRIEHGAYPATLQAANHPGEKTIPLDVISGKPMGYRRTPNGKYLLWCVALDNQDHGGTRVLDPVQPDNTKFADPSYTGDWVWDYPPKHKL